MSAGQIYVKPAPGFIMRDEFTKRVIPAEGYWVKRSSLVIRRMLTRVGGTNEVPIFELNLAEPPKEAAPETKRKPSERAEKVEG